MGVLAEGITYFTNGTPYILAKYIMHYVQAYHGITSKY